MPAPGDIHVVHNERLQAFVAYQLTHQDQRDGSLAVLTLDWTGTILPDPATIAGMQPARFNYLQQDNALHHRWVGKRPPRDFLHVGWRAPLIEAAPKIYGSWPDGAEVAHQRRWDALDAAAVEAFKHATAAQEDRSVLLERGEHPIRRCATCLDAAAMNLAPSLALFDALPLLTQLDISKPVPGLLPWLRTRPLIHSLDICHLQDTTLDLRGTGLIQASIDASGLRHLHLNDGLSRLTLHGTLEPDLLITAEDDGRWLTLISTDATLAWAGLPSLGELQLRDVRELDGGRIAERFPQLRALHVTGAPAVLHGLQRLGELQQLHTLSASDVFPPEDAVFPAPGCWPRLCRLWLGSVPAALGAAIRKAYKREVASGLDLAVTQLRTPDWLAANLDNPFRDWDGSAQVSSAQAKAAATLYRKACSEALKLASAGGDAAAVTEALARVGRTYTEGFNALDRRSGFIETEEREQIYTAWLGIVDAVEARSGMALDREVLRAAMNEARTF
ncbi:gliding motility protein [Stenotrophomonas sp. ZAC14D1_NAIMI4_6]|uniref:gliding motility protein n=1 Tax=unclassified Stenotrophomonas maltophilia group TaxID=2961925 RepID=UPI000D540449|nr:MULTISPECIES: gliding motility protein [unclassified Stenotrophomonas maltophilia group]AWH37825.1 gliding motility protein [Stenotrophomonas sp. ZAC14D1_NAIMI4_6]AWH41958.1 gliding motility protein [Stenotrophomonas sp. ZAC14D1_NAIMI4_1]